MNSKMKSNVILLAVFCGYLTVSAVSLAKPTDEKKHGKDRVIDSDLSDEKHFDDNGVHNHDYDHEAFLGEEESRMFDDLSPEESLERLGKIYERIDKDSDNLVTEEELVDWINYSQRRYIIEDVEKQWSLHDLNKDGSLAWDEYKKTNYGFIKEDDVEEMADYKEMIQRDERRWKAADKDDDGSLTKEEFTDFLHPEESQHMRDIVVQETIEDIDKDKDGMISLEEYIGDMFNTEGESEEPEWVKSEREQFTQFRDADKDGKMDAKEVSDWIMPPDYDHVKAEARHLIFESDTDKDKSLTKEEVLEHHDVFVGSQATDFGDALRRHDEF